jgi:phosphoribosylformylglycinamidine synthase
MSLLVLPGTSCLSEFRAQRLLAELAPRAPGLSAVRALEFFVVDAGETPLDALRTLLGPGPQQFPEAALRLFVLPRIGTRSPWSSKATDIAAVCGLAEVRRIEAGRVYLFDGVSALPDAARALLFDPMTESLLDDPTAIQSVFDTPSARPLRRVELLAGGVAALETANRDWGLALSGEEIAYLHAHFTAAGRNPTDAELMMFGQVNSEHCRHKIFNAEFTVDGEVQPHSLFQMIRMTHAATPQGVLSAYKDNSAVVEGPVAARFFRDADHHWRMHEEPVHLLMKVETHNHPTGISPHPGAGTGAGGEIRDEAATGRGARPKAGLAGFTVANLRIPGFEQPWEAALSRPARMASALDIMIEAPLGAAAYNNEFGRPNLNGYFRSLELVTPDGRNRGYHKPIMIAGGYGNIRGEHVEKLTVIEGAALVVLGGPAMLIGLGGGAASSMATGASSADLDFASVQRANPELERRCQEVIDACWALGAENPILSIHDVGAGGISNALPELVHADDRGGHFQLRDVIAADPSLSPMEIWCNESQERYVLAVAPAAVPVLAAACARERCPYAVVGTATAERQLKVEDQKLGAPAVDMPMEVLLGKTPRMHRSSTRSASLTRAFAYPANDATELPAWLTDAVQRLLRLPAVASKQFLITIGDRSVGGLTVRDQMVGPWQVPVADCAVTATGFEATTGEAMAMGERPTLALLDAAASARMAVGEALTNIAAAAISRMSDIRLSANWMAACGVGDEDARLFDAVKAVGAELCPQLGIAIPVGKDSLSMKTVWSADGQAQTQAAPVSLIVSAFATVADVRRSLTPQLRMDQGPTQLLLIDLGAGRNRLGGSALAQVFGEVGETAPDLDSPATFAAAFRLLQCFNEEGRVLAYHDRSDGGLFVTLAEMAFAGHCGLDIELGDQDLVPALFCEELGMVLQVRDVDAAGMLSQLQAAGLSAVLLGRPTRDGVLRLRQQGQERYAAPRSALYKAWSETSYRIAGLRDNPECVEEEFADSGRDEDPGLKLSLRFSPDTAPMVSTARPRVAILREQGVNGQVEMAYAFHAAGFEAVDVHMSDLLESGGTLDGYTGVVACGGFSYGDVLGAGQGWAKTILFNARVREVFARFFEDPRHFALGVCNGCQMMAALKSIVPGAEHWPAFRRNRSQQFEARWTQVEILESRSLFFAGMTGSLLPIAVAHGEGRAEFAADADLQQLKAAGQMAMRYVDANGATALRYPANPNGSPEGLSSVCNSDGRITILMPHPERTIAGVTGSWWPSRDAGFTPWFRMFQNARQWVG